MNSIFPPLFESTSAYLKSMLLHPLNNRTVVDCLPLMHLKLKFEILQISGFIFILGHNDSKSTKKYFDLARHNQMNFDTQ